MGNLRWARRRTTGRDEKETEILRLGKINHLLSRLEESEKVNELEIKRRV